MKAEFDSRITAEIATWKWFVKDSNIAGSLKMRAAVREGVRLKQRMTNDLIDQGVSSGGIKVGAEIIEQKWTSSRSNLLGAR